MEEQLINKVMVNEIKPSIGCTEPSAIAYTVANAKKYVENGDEIKNVRVLLSTNVLKNALCVTLPNTTLHGVELIVILGLMCENIEDRLTIFRGINKNILKKALEYQKEVNVEIDVIESVNPLYIQVNIETNKHKIMTVMINEHDDIKKIVVDENIIINKKIDYDESICKIDKLKYDNILSFIKGHNYNIDLMKNVEKSNLKIADYGMKNKTGMNIGNTIKSNNIFKSEFDNVISKTVAGIDSRMSGVMKKVYINSGSGNQGITATIPIIEMAKILNVDDSIKYQALALSHLTAIYIHSKQNKLSSTCGAVIASCGVAAGICYMLGGTDEQIKGAILNTLCSNFGIFCDGAKETCSFKVMSVVSTAINSAYLAKSGVFVNKNLGIISTDFEKTLDVLTTIEHEMTKRLDSTIMKAAMNNK